MAEQLTYFHHLLLHHADIAYERDELCNAGLKFCLPKLNGRIRLFLDLTMTKHLKSKGPCGVQSLNIGLEVDNYSNTTADWETATYSKLDIAYLLIKNPGNPKTW